jgi:hypothetical protein
MCGKSCLGCRLPWHRLPQRPVHLERRVVPLEPAHIVTQPRRQMVPADQPSVQAGRCHRSENGAARRDLHSGSGTHRNRSPVANDDLPHPVPAADHPAPPSQPPDERGGELPGPAFGHRPAVLVAKHRQQPAVHGTARGFGHQVSVQRAARQQQRPRAGELFLDEPAHREQRKPREPQQPRCAQPCRQSHPRAHRRERHEQRVQQVRSQALPQPMQPPPRRAISPAQLLEPCGSARDIARQHRRMPIRQRVREHMLGVRPPQPVPLKLQGLHHSRPSGQRVERTAVVIQEIPHWALATAHPATRLRLLLTHDDLPASIGQDIRRDQPIRPCPDNHRIRRSRTAALCHAAPLPHPPAVNQRRTLGLVTSCAAGTDRSGADPENSHKSVCRTIPIVSRIAKWGVLRAC